MARPQNIHSYLKNHNRIANDMIDIIDHKFEKDNNQLLMSNFEQIIRLLTLECKLKFDKIKSKIIFKNLFMIFKMFFFSRRKRTSIRSSYSMYRRSTPKDREHSRSRQRDRRVFRSTRPSLVFISLLAFISNFRLA